MKILSLTVAFLFAVMLFGCGIATGSATATNPEGSIAQPVAEPTPKKAKAAKPAGDVSQSVIEAAYSPVYGKNDKSCKNHDKDATEGEEFVRECKGYGKFSLWVYGSAGNINYRIESGDPNDLSAIYLFPLEDGDASEFVRADKYSEKLGDKIEWRLDVNGTPYAIIVRAFFFKNVGAKTFAHPKNRVGEFLLVRGLGRHRDLKVDIKTRDTAYNANEWARKVADEYLESKQVKTN